MSEAATPKAVARTPAAPAPALPQDVSREDYALPAPTPRGHIDAAEPESGCLPVMAHPEAAYADDIHVFGKLACSVHRAANRAPRGQIRPTWAFNTTRYHGAG